MAAAIAKFRDVGGALPKAQSLDDTRRNALEQRRWFNAEPPALARIEERAIAGPHRAIPVRLYVPQGAALPAPAIVYCHGGGWFACSNDTHDRILRLLAIASCAAVIGVDYCLAPENKFPKPVEEAAAVLDWIAAHAAEWHLDPERLAFGGCSAGANVVLGAALSLPPEMLARFRAGALFYGAYDPDLSSDSCRRFGADGEWLGVKEMAWCWKQYLAREEDRADPRAAPLRAGDSALVRLPPLYLAAAGIDPLRDDTVRLAARLNEAGLRRVLSVREGLGHSFLGFARMVDEARAVLQDAADFVNAVWAEARAQEKVSA
jgi:acetyl esterase